MIIKNHYKTFSFFAILISFLNCSEDNAITLPTNLGPGDISLISTLGGSKNESARAICKTSDGGYAILGYTQSVDGDITDKINENFDYWVLKFNSENGLEWSKTFGGTLDDRGNDIIQTSDGGYAILGFTSSSDEDVSNNAGAQDYWVSKLDMLGNLIWQKSYGYSGIDNGISLIETSDNGFLLTGVLDVSASGGQGNTKMSSFRHAGGDYWAIKLNPTGDIQWSKYYGGSFTDTPYDVIETNTGYMIIGSSDSQDVDISNSRGSYDFWVLSISTTGDLLWEKSYGGNEIDEARAISKSDDGNYIIVGDTRSNDQDVSQNFGAADLWIIKINPSGDLLWEKTIGGSNFDVGRSVERTEDLGFLISGSSRSADGNINGNNGQNDAWLLKIDSNASIQWQQTIGGSNIDFFYDATQLIDNTFIAVGESNSNNGDIVENKGFTDLLLTHIK